jgi:uncharacterized protein
MSTKRNSPAPYVQPYRYPAPDVPLAVIRRFARGVAKRFGPRKIILFGSHAYGTPHAESDVDLLVIMPASNVTDQAVQICQAFDWPFSLDLIVRTPRQVERGLKEGNWFLREVIEKGQVVYEAPDRPVGTQGRGGSGRRSRSGGAESTPPRPRLLPLPVGGGEVPQGAATRVRPRRAENAQPR